ncbi:MAG TPA: hypothetical protein VFR49_14930 [Solirubrobacteraceae bacterium]|nr:hypothetical protein [Solirubrobacteraceae bacterium]
MATAIGGGLAWALLWLGVPAGALAATFAVPRLPGSSVAPSTVPVVVGAQPVGDGIVYASGSYAGGWTVWLTSPDGARRALAVVAAPAGASDDIAVHASTTRLAVTDTAIVCDDPSEGCKYGNFRSVVDQILAGPLGGPLAVIACHGTACGAGFACSDGGPGFTAVLGDDLLAARDNCSGTLAVVNLATGTGTALASAPYWAVAGGFVAVTQAATPAVPADLTSTITVRDAASGAEIYQAGLPALAVPAGPQLALLADGSLAYLAPVASGGVALVLASPAAPAGRVLRFEDPATTIDGAGPAGVLTGSPAAGLELAPLDGGPPVRVPLAVSEGVAFDGRTVAVTEGLCVTKTIASWRVGDPAPAPFDDRCPTPSPARAAVTLHTDRRLRVTIACPATTPSGCPATVDLTARLGPVRRGAPTARRRSYPLGRVEVALDPGRRGPAELLLTAAAARWVRRHAPLRLTVAVRNTVCCADRRPPGDPGAITRTVPLRASPG